MPLGHTPTPAWAALPQSIAARANGGWREEGREEGRKEKSQIQKCCDLRDVSSSCNGGMVDSGRERNSARSFLQKSFSETRSGHGPTRLQVKDVRTKNSAPSDGVKVFGRRPPEYPPGRLQISRPKT